MFKKVKVVFGVILLTMACQVFAGLNFDVDNKIKGRLCYFKTKTGLKIPRVDILELKYEEDNYQGYKSYEILSVELLNGDIYYKEDIVKIVFCDSYGSFSYKPEKEVIVTKQKTVKARVYLCNVIRKEEYEFKKITDLPTLVPDRKKIGGCSGGG